MTAPTHSDIFNRFESHLQSNSDFNKLWIARNLKHIYNIFIEKFPKKKYSDFIEKYGEIRMLISVNSFNFCKMILILKNHITFTDDSDFLYIILHILKNGIEISPIVNNLIVQIAAIVNFDLYTYYENTYEYFPEIMMRIVLLRIKCLLRPDLIDWKETSFFGKYKEKLCIEELKKKYTSYYNRLDLEDVDEMFEQTLFYNQLEYFNYIKDDWKGYDRFKVSLIRHLDDNILISNKVLFLYYKILSYDTSLEIFTKLINYKKQQAYFLFNENLNLKLLKKMNRDLQAVDFKSVYYTMDNRVEYFTKFIYLIGLDYDFITDLFQKLRKNSDWNFDSIFSAVKIIFILIGKNEKILKRNFFVKNDEDFSAVYSEKLDEFILSFRKKKIETEHFTFYHDKKESEKFPSVLNLFRNLTLTARESVNLNMTCKNERNIRLINLIGETLLFFSKHKDDRIRHRFLKDLIEHENVFNLFSEKFRNEILLNLILNMEHLRWSYRMDLCKFTYKKITIEYFLKLFKNDRVFAIRKLVDELCREIN